MILKTNLHIFCVKEDEKTHKGMENILSEIIAEYFPNLRKDMHIWV
jgi:hypothetical protein